MFEYQRKPSFTAKALTICAIGMGIGFGTCGLAVLSGYRDSTATFFAGAGRILFLVSLVGAVITIVKKIIDRFLK